MGLMDRMREQAAQVAQRTAEVTQEAAQQGKAMLDQAQAPSISTNIIHPSRRTGQPHRDHDIRGATAPPKS